MCSFIDSMCVSSCRCCVLVSVVHPVTILSEMVYAVYSMLIFVVTILCKHTRVWVLLWYCIL